MKKQLKRAAAFLVFCAILAGMALSGCGSRVMEADAVYLGVEDYGAPQTNHDNIENFRYRFLIDGDETVLSIDSGEPDAEGAYTYPIQNVLKEGYSYHITYRSAFRGGTVTAAEELPSEPVEFTPVISGTPGERTLGNFLRTAMMPVGTTLYVFGGGWNWQDSAAAAVTRTLGVSPDWVRFFREQDENYTFKSRDDDEANADPANSYYPYGGFNEYYYAGLDCSGYLGWAVYNTFQTQDGVDTFFSGSTGWAHRLADEGWGAWTQDVAVPAALAAGGAQDADEDGAEDTAGNVDAAAGGADAADNAEAADARTMRPGDIMSINGHVWISLGTCADGSVVVAHSTPTNSRTGQPGGGVQIGAVGPDESCEAWQLADRYMSEYFPEWYARYETTLKDPEIYFTFEGDTAGWFTWDTTGAGGGLTDPEGFQEMMPEEVLAALFA